MNLAKAPCYIHCICICICGKVSAAFEGILRILCSLTMNGHLVRGQWMKWQDICVAKGQPCCVFSGNVNCLSTWFLTKLIWANCKWQMASGMDNGQRINQLSCCINIEFISLIKSSWARLNISRGPSQTRSKALLLIEKQFSWHFGVLGLCITFRSTVNNGRTYVRWAIKKIHFRLRYSYN